MTTSFQPLISDMVQRAKRASFAVAGLTTERKNQVLRAMAHRLVQESARIEAENAKDLAAARDKGLSSALIDRLILNHPRIQEMARGLEEVAMLPDPVGAPTRHWSRPNGLQIKKVRIPLGVIGIIYESRPNVTVDAAGLCFKSGNITILRGGSEALHSNKILGDILRETLEKEGLSADFIQVVPIPNREAVEFLLKQDQSIDLIIPRGGPQLMQFIREHSKIPVIRHDKGVCHVFVDESADIAMAQKIVLNSKVQRPGVCNALETLLIHEKIAAQFLPGMIEKLEQEGVEIRACEKTLKIVPHLKEATPADWGQEFLDLILAAKVVRSLEEAIQHIDQYGSLHTEVIVTKDQTHADRFLREVNASVVAVNASTRFNDGGQLGLGAEIGISTTKLHAFGPMGLEELTTQKYVIHGEGQIRE